MPRPTRRSSGSGRWKRLDLIGRGLRPGASQAESAELVAARQKIRDLEEENKILRKAAAAVREVVPPKERYRLVAEHCDDGVRVRQACYALDVSPSGYYDWKTRAPSARPIRHAWLTDLTGQVHGASYGTYGQPRVRAELQRTHGLMIGPSTVALLMRRAGLSGLPLRRRAKRVPAQKTVTGLVKRQFTADSPNRLWVTGITEHPTREGKACYRVVTGVLSRRVVGWATGTAQRADLATNALGMAIDSRGAAALARHRRRPLRQRGRRVLLGTHASGAAQPAAVENRVELANAIFEYIEGFHNRRRRHSALGWPAR